MALKEKIRKIITGLSIPQEYLCVGFETFKYPLSIRLAVPGNSRLNIDVANNHLFLGYRPLVIALYYKTGDADTRVLDNHQSVHIGFYWRNDRAGKPSAGQSGNKSVARLVLQLIDAKKLNDYTVFIYRGVRGDHKFLNAFNQFINRKRQQFRRQALGNVDLPGNLMDQVRIAYAVPRVISVITIADGTRMNVFPTDLHGPVDDDFYLGSLRLGGKANQQVDEIRKIAISEMPLTLYKMVYQLGKNHMRELCDGANFSLHEDRSEILNLPLPAGVLSYRELIHRESLDVGIHRIHIYKIINRKIVQEGETLSHIHQFCAQWRLDQGLSTKFFLR